MLIAGGGGAASWAYDSQSDFDSVFAAYSSWSQTACDDAPGSSPGPSSQSSEGPDRSKSPSLVTLYPTLGYQAIMQEMSPTVLGKFIWQLKRNGILMPEPGAYNDTYLLHIK